jgi:hypothetical protein
MNATFNKYKAREFRSFVHPVQLARYSISDLIDLNRNKNQKGDKKKIILN